MKDIGTFLFSLSMDGTSRLSVAKNAILYLSDLNKQSTIETHANITLAKIKECESILAERDLPIKYRVFALSKYEQELSYKKSLNEQNKEVYNRSKNVLKELIKIDKQSGLFDVVGIFEDDLDRVKRKCTKVPTINKKEFIENLYIRTEKNLESAKVEYGKLQEELNEVKEYSRKIYTLLCKDDISKETKIGALGFIGLNCKSDSIEIKKIHVVDSLVTLDIKSREKLSDRFITAMEYAITEYLNSTIANIDIPVNIKVSKTRVIY